MRKVLLIHISSIGCCNPLVTMLNNGNFGFPYSLLPRFPLPRFQSPRECLMLNNSIQKLRMKQRLASFYYQEQTVSCVRSQVCICAVRVTTKWLMRWWRLQHVCSQLRLDDGTSAHHTTPYVHITSDAVSWSSQRRFKRTVVVVARLLGSRQDNATWSCCAWSWTLWTVSGQSQGLYTVRADYWS